MSDKLMPLQTDPGLRPEIQKEGCLFMTYLRVGSIVNRTTWDVHQVNLAYEFFRDLGHITDRCKVLHPDLILRKLGIGLTGWITKAPLGYRPGSNEILIEEWYNPPTAHTHFVMGLPYFWDSLGESVTRRDGSLVSYRVIPVAKFEVPHGGFNA